MKKYPEGSRKQAYKDQKRSYQVFAKVSGQSYEEFIGALGQTDEDIQSSADDQVKARMTAKTIAIKEGLTLSDADYERFLFGVFRAGRRRGQDFESNGEKISRRTELLSER